MSDETYKMLRAAAIFPMDESTVRKIKNGVVIEISDETLAALTRNRRKRETYDNVIKRILAFGGVTVEPPPIVLH
jgi:hypothetical protein